MNYLKGGQNIMNKKIKYGNIQLSEDEFKDENALIRISMMIPVNIYKELKKLSLNEDCGGKYQLLIRDILNDYVQKHSSTKKKKQVS